MHNKYKTSEKYFERKLREEVKNAGGYCVKLNAIWFRGIPDRMVMMPGRKVYYVELKSTGKDLSAAQKIVQKEFKRLGHEVHIIDSLQTLQNFLDLIL